MPNVLTERVGNPYVVVIHGGHYSRAPNLVERGQCFVQIRALEFSHEFIVTGAARGVLYVVDMEDETPGSSSCQIRAWQPPGIEEISEVFHARIVDYGYPTHCHDTWTVLIVDAGAISYDLDRRQCGALGETVAILPPGVTHNGKPAPGANGFSKRVLYLAQSALPLELIGAAVDRTNIQDIGLRRSISTLHDELAIGADPFAASTALAQITERITEHLTNRLAHTPDVVSRPHLDVAQQLRLMLDETTTEQVTLDQAAQRLDRSKAHLVRSFSSRYGVAPHAYLIGKRVEAARKLLLDGMPTAEVATTVGFYDQSHFTRHFKRHTTVPPATFAASCNGPRV